MPMISSFRSNPSLTPVTMLATRARASPCSARTWRSSLPRSITRVPSCIFGVRPAGTGWLSLPLGPPARTVRPSTETFAPWGILIGCLPMRDMSGSLPHVGEDFPADFLLARLAVGDDTARGRDQGHAHAAQDRGDVVVAHVDPAAGRRHSHQARDHLLVASAVLKVDAQGGLLAVLEHA